MSRSPNRDIMMPRFTILRHRVGAEFSRGHEQVESGIAVGDEHWDWLFATADPGPGLLTWATDPLAALAEDVVRFPVASVPALRLADHRERYLDFEGELDGDRGMVSQLASGRYRLVRRASSRFEANLVIEASRYFEPATAISVTFARTSDADREPSDAWDLRVR